MASVQQNALEELRFFHGIDYDNPQGYMEEFFGDDGGKMCSLPSIFL